MADASALGADAREGMEVQVLSRAHIAKKTITRIVFFAILFVEGEDLN